MNAEQLHTPCYVIDRDRLEENLKVLRGVMDRTGCRILLAQKAFSCYFKISLWRYRKRTL